MKLGIWKIKSHWITIRRHQIAKLNLYFCLQQDILKQQFFFKAGKGKGSRRQKTFTSPNRITKFLVPWFHINTVGNEITTR